MPGKKRHVCLQKAAEALVRYWSDGLVKQLNKNVLRCLLKLCSESHNMSASVGRLFQMTGAA